MPAVSKAQQRFMGMVHAAQKGDMENPSPEVSKAADSMSDKDAKDFASTSHKGLPDKKEEQLNKIREIIRKMVRERMIDEMNVTGNVQGYNTPHAFGKPGDEKKKGKKQADLTGYSIVKESHFKVGDKVKMSHGGIGVVKSLDKKDGSDDEKYYNIELPNGDVMKHSPNELVSINENRWLALKQDESTAQAKIGRGISNINKQLKEMERFLNWYGKIKNESGVDNKSYWKRTNSHIYTIKERLIKLDQKIRQISE